MTDSTKTHETELIKPPTVGEVFDNIDQAEAKRESTRSYIALIYVVAYLLIIVGSLIVSFYKTYTIDETKDILLAISGILSGPLGFVIGYYFKASNE